MSSTFFGISVAQSALAAQRRAMDVLGYNIAHANDPTYKRQRMVMVEGSVLAASQEASPLGSTPFGTGVGSGDVERVRDALIENRLREATQASSKWAYMSNTLSQLEAAIGEPSDTGLQNDLDTFWASWQKVSTSPDSLPIRSALLEDASALCQRMQYTYNQMGALTDDLNMAAIDRVDRVNLIAEEIGRLNNEIGALSSGMIPVNDLLNRRDALVQELSKTVAISQHGDSKDNFIISIGGTVLVQGTKVNRLKTEVGIGGEQLVLWERDSEPVNVAGGELKAILDLRDNMIPSYLKQLDDVAVALVDAVNTAHQSGQTMTNPPVAGGDFFRAGTTAANISLDDSIIGHPELVAASSSDAATSGIGNGQVALQISLLKNQPMAGGFTINQMYRAFIGDIGGSSATAKTQAEAHELSLQQFTTQQQSVSGVSLDEEMTNMIKFQQAYNSAARVLTTMDEMLDVLINKT
ncbi:MAG: flagellar hook-associated protein FlgK [Armatimonadota bacterium]